MTRYALRQTAGILAVACAGILVAFIWGAFVEIEHGRAVFAPQLQGKVNAR